MLAREITPEVRKRVGLPSIDETPYRWTFALFTAALAAVPLLLAGLYKTGSGVFVIALGVLPGMRWHERKERALRERVYTDGAEVIGRVTAVEPGGDRRTDRPVRIEFFADGVRVQTTVLGSPLARKGLEPGEDVVVLYDPADPRRCLILERVARKKKPPRHLRAVAPS